MKRLIELFLPVFYNVLFIDDKNWAIGQAWFNFLFSGKLQTSIATCVHHPASCIAHHEMLSIHWYFPPSFLYKWRNADENICASSNKLRYCCQVRSLIIEGVQGIRSGWCHSIDLSWLTDCLPWIIISNEFRISMNRVISIFQRGNIKDSMTHDRVEQLDSLNYEWEHRRDFLLFSISKFMKIEK